MTSTIKADLHMVKPQHHAKYLDHFCFVSDRDTQYCDERVRMSVCFKSVRSNISKTTCPNFTKFLHMLPVAVAWSSSDENACS